MSVTNQAQPQAEPQAEPQAQPQSQDATRLPTSTRAMRQAKGLVLGMRPRQWIKSLLVLAAPAMAGVIFRPATLSRALAAMAAFTLVAAGTYLINDSRDAQADRLHPDKRHRPVASGLISAPMAMATGGGAMIVGILVCLLVTPWLAVVVGIYATMTISYSLWLKRMAYVELGVVVAGFLLRAIAGAVATDVGASARFLLVALAGALFVVVAKRSAEQEQLGSSDYRHRSALGVYSARFLRLTQLAGLAGALGAYCWWALTKGPDASGWFIFSIVFFAALLFRYAYCASTDRGAAPEEIVLGDRLVQALAGGWIVVVMVGVYGS